MRFLSTPSARRATAAAVVRPRGRENFYPRPPRGGRPGAAAAHPSEGGISIHALREEGDPGNVPCRRWRSIYFYPRPPRGGRRNFRQTATAKPTISIHALREEGDLWSWRHAACLFISIHALREEGDQALSEAVAQKQKFLSTPSARRATSSSRRSSSSAKRFLSTPSARRATAKTETKSLFSNKLYNILHEFRRALIYNGSKNDPNHAK